MIDTVGVKTDRPYAMIDLFGTPYTKSLHIVERYRLREYDDVKDAIERNKKENWLFHGDVFSKHRGKFLQVHLTIDDAGVFTTPWTATLTYVPRPDVAAEVVCAENPHEYYQQQELGCPDSREAGLLNRDRRREGEQWLRIRVIARRANRAAGAAGAPSSRRAQYPRSSRASR